MLNPPSLRPFTGITINTADSTTNANAIDSQSGISYTTTGKGVFGSLSSVTVSDYPSVTDMGTYKFILVVANPLPINSYIQFSFDSSFTVPSGTLTMTCNTNCAGTSTATISGGVYTFNGLFSSYLGQLGTVIFSITGLQNPSSTTPGTFYITSYEYSSVSTGYAVDYIGTLTFTATQGTISISKVAPTDITRIYELPTSYTIILTPQHAVQSTYKLVLTFPSDFSVQSSSCTVTGLASSASCITSSSANTITIYNMVTSAGTAGTTYTFTVTQIKNPGNYNTPGSLSASLQTSSSTLVDSGSYSFSSCFTTSSYIESYSVSPGAYTVGTYPTTYTFTIRPRAKVKSGAYIELSFPSDLGVPDTSSINVAPLSGFSSSRLSYRYRSYNNVYQVTKGFDAGDTSGDPPTLIFTMSNIRNPRTIQTTGVFGAKIYDGSDNVLYTWNYTTTPTIQMNSAAAPSYVAFTRDSSQNGAITNVVWTVTVNNYYQDTDIISVTSPSTVYFSELTKCIGLSYLSTSLTCSVSTDLQTMNIVVSVSARRRMLASIDSGKTIQFRFTNVQNGPTLQPTSSSFQYSAKTSTGYALEQQTTGLTVTNSVPGTLSYQSAGVTPSTFMQSITANYTISFIPRNYQQGMTIVVTVPSQLTFPSSGSMACKGVSGVETTSLICTTDTSKRTVTITNGFTFSKYTPLNVTFVLDNLKNPSTKSITDSFQINTFTSNGYAIDTLSTNLTVNFLCMYPCKTCTTDNASTCLSCYSTVVEKWLYNSQCLSTCPSTLFQDLTANTCSQCNSPCLACQTTATNCTSCIVGYGLKGNMCDNSTTLDIIDGKTKKSISLPYFFPFAACGVLMFMITLIGMCCSKDTKFRESAVALIAIPELLSWAALVFCFKMYLNDNFLFLISIGAIGLHVIFNFIYGIVHQTKIIPDSNREYQNFLKRYHGCHSFVIFLSFVYSFKMHHLILSRFAGGKHLNGNFNAQGWKSWNIIALLYIFTSYAAIMASCALFFMNNYSNIGSLIYLDFFNIHYLVCEVVFLSTIIAILLLMGVCKTCSCSKDDKLKPKQNDEKYNKVENEPSSMLEDSGSDIIPKKKRVNRRTRLDEDEMIEDLESNKKRKSFRNIIDIQLTDEEEMDDSVRKKETDPLTANSRVKKIAMDQEVEYLNQLTIQMKDERELLRDEKRLILKERERLLKERDDQHNQFQSLHKELKEDRMMLKQDKDKLDKQREEFLTEIDNRIQKRLEDWETRSMGSISRREFRPTQGYASDGSDEQPNSSRMYKNLKQQQDQQILIQDETPNKLNMIKEERNESDDEDLNRILQQADEVLRHQEKLKEPIKPAIEIRKKPKAHFERVTAQNHLKESKQEIGIQLNKPIFKYAEGDETTRNKQGEEQSHVVRPQAHFEKGEQTNQEKTSTQQNFYIPEKAVCEKVDDSQIEKNATQQNFYAQATATQGKEDNVKEKQSTQQHFYNREQAVYSSNDETREMANISQEFVEREQAIFSRENAEREKSGTTQGFFKGEQGIYAKDDGSKERHGTQQDFYNPDQAVYGKQDGSKERHGTQQDFYNRDQAAFGKDDGSKERHGTEQDFYNRDQAAYGKQDGSNEKYGTQQDFFKGDRALFSRENNDRDLRGTQQQFFNKDQAQYGKEDGANQRQGTDEEFQVNEKAEFGIDDNMREKEDEQYNEMPNDSGSDIEISPSRMDHKNNEHKGFDPNESLDEIPMNENENFYPNEDSNENLDRGAKKEIVTEDLDKNRNFVKKKKKVLYSDKSESSIDEMMEDTPSNYNIPNGRLDGKSLGLKAVLLHAKKQGLKLQQLSETPQGVKGPQNSITPDMLKQSQTPNLLAKGRLGQVPKMKVDEERKFVNNLFKETHNNALSPLGTRQIMQSPDKSNGRKPTKKKKKKFDSGSEAASWRPFNQPLRKQKPMVVGENSITIDQQNNDQRTLDLQDSY